MGQKKESGQPDRVFVLRFWLDPGGEARTWQGEVKELGASRQSDQRFKVSGVSGACEVINAQLKRPAMRE
ncbi:hypothetical protein [Mesorhizobium sp. ES1-6]|uniref:hypothetical protein n=1 Tax=Mesorhizobium sp. ES1-6 TaxID=2876626 RepID=UPI001CCA46BA|nr:hypothetical protein [Mesorhizobium sp. ES1-6]MBZ9803448.1 hypothetical protein [Mesorhizobium sp. ES1-6]